MPPYRCHRLRLTAHCIADQRGWNALEIRDRVRNTPFRGYRVRHEHGFYAHFLNIQNGERVSSRKFPPSTPPSFFAACSPAAPILTTLKLRAGQHDF
jgi:hypothetical protein